MSLRIIFAGTPDFAAHHLQALLDSRHQVVAVFTQPDRPANRGKKITPSPVKLLALEHGVPVHQPEKLKAPEDQALLAQYQADLMVVVAYGLLLPKAVLELPRLGCINVHASLLPRWRGAAPIQRAIEAGDPETGVTIMQMDVGLDTGDMLHIRRCPIEAGETGGSLHDKLWRLGCPALIDAIDQLAAGQARPVPQDHALANYAHKLTKEEARLDWRRPARELERQVRAFNPFPVCFSELAGERLRIWSAQTLDVETRLAPGTLLGFEQDQLRVACGAGVLALTELQLAGKKAMRARELMAGYSQKFAKGLCFDPIPE